MHGSYSNPIFCPGQALGTLFHESIFMMIFIGLQNILKTMRETTGIPVSSVQSMLGRYAFHHKRVPFSTLL